MDIKNIIIIALCLIPVEALGLTYSPLVYNECLNRSIEIDFNNQPRWIKFALENITRNGQAMSRDMTDIVLSDCGAFGVFHLQPDHYPLNIGYITECAFDDQEWQFRILALLYSDYSAIWQIYEWEGKVDVAVYPARRNGLNSREVGAIAALANSSPSLALRLGIQYDWDVEQMVHGYIADRINSNHRRRRGEFILDNL